ncbi:MAG TPA: type I DNA topoisomerase [Candidatus Limnocylindria bacterium]|nr:type I DNA topoisomerase [Candidatus Limnocylindria bacterium]
MQSKKHKLVIVESPAKARTVAKYLGSTYKVEASQGHVRDLPKSQFGVDTGRDFEMKYITIKGRGDILAKLRKLARGASSVFLATDPDREGEAISWHLAKALGLDDTKPIRVEFEEITKNAVREAMKAPRVIDMDRVNAQQARRALDRIVGYEISPLLWAKVKKGLSAGRVQSAALRLIVEREEEIDAFIPEEYWDVSADFLPEGMKARRQPLRARLALLSGKKADIRSEKAAAKARDKIASASFTLDKVKRGTRATAPAAPFTTSTLQQEASRKLNFTSSRTMQVVQGLYEGVDLGREGTMGLVTYIRTDSVRVSEEALAAAREAIPALYGSEYLPAEPRRYKSAGRAQDAHEAIRPSRPDLTPDAIKEFLSRDQYLLYRLIHARFLASQMADAVYETLTAELAAPGVMLRYSAQHKTFAGFTAAYEEGTDDNGVPADSVLPQLREGDPVKVTEVFAEQKFTQPPTRFTEASLIRALEEKGIGRPSTYAPTIGTLLARGYVTREKKRLFPSEMGRMVSAIMQEHFPDVADTEFTAQMEGRLDEVAEGKADWKDILRGFYPDFRKTVEAAEAKIEKVDIPDEVSDVPCDVCGAMMVYKMGRFGRFLACPRFPECRSTKPVVVRIEAPCPVCGAGLLEKTTRKGRKFYGCERYPDCDFTSWDLVAREKCPVCGGYMVRKQRRSGPFLLCANPACRHHEEVPEPAEAADA